MATRGFDVPATESASVAGLSAVLTIPEIAKRAGWSVSKMRRFLLAKNRELGGVLLFNAGRGSQRPRWTVSIRALRSIAAPWFVDGDYLQEQIDYLAERIDDTREQVATQGGRVAILREARFAIARELAESRGGPRLAVAAHARRARSGSAA